MGLRDLGMRGVRGVRGVRDSGDYEASTIPMSDAALKLL
jgi:hypothetical protein